MLRIATTAASAIPSGAKAKWNKTIFTEIIAVKIRAKPFHLLIINSAPATISVRAIRGNIYPVFPKAPIKSAGSPSIGGIGKKLKNLLSPNTSKINPKSNLNAIVNFEFIIIKVLVYN